MVAGDTRRGRAGGRSPAARPGGAPDERHHSGAGARPGQARVARGGLSVKYLYLLYANESKLPGPGSPEFDQQNAAYGSFYEEAAGPGGVQSGDPVQPSSSSTTVRVRNGSPQAAAAPCDAGQGQMHGFYGPDCQDRDEAVR